jgi:hypothetical protein
MAFFFNIAVQAQMGGLKEQARDKQSTGAPIIHEEFKIKYLTAFTSSACSGTPSAANKCAPETLQSLELTIRNMLTESGDNRASVNIVPGKKVLSVDASNDQLIRIRELIDSKDKPRTQFLVRATVFWAKKNFFSCTVLKTDDFKSSLARFEQSKNLHVQSRMYAVVTTGETMSLATRITVPVPTEAYRAEFLRLGNPTGFFNAERVFEITPHSIADNQTDVFRTQTHVYYRSEDSDPFTTKEQLTDRGSINTDINIQEDETAIIGGILADDSTSSVQAGRKSPEHERLYIALTIERVPQGLAAKQ